MPSPAERWVGPTDKNGHAPWFGARSNGFPIYAVSRGKYVSARRALYVQAWGPLDPRAFVGTSCGFRDCVATAHLVVRESAAPHTTRLFVGGTCRRGHGLDAPEAIYVNQRGVRACRQCIRDRAKARYARAKEASSAKAPPVLAHAAEVARQRIDCARASRLSEEQKTRRGEDRAMARRGLAEKAVSPDRAGRVNDAAPLATPPALDATTAPKIREFRSLPSYLDDPEYACAYEELGDRFAEEEEE